MLSTEKRNQIADLITEQACKVIREQVDIDWPDDDPADVLAIERQVAVQLLTGQRSMAIVPNLEHGDVETLLRRTGVIKTN